MLGSEDQTEAFLRSFRSDMFWQEIGRLKLKSKNQLAAFLLIFVSPRTRGESFLFENHSLQSGKTFKCHPEIATTLPITT